MLALLGHVTLSAVFFALSFPNFFFIDGNSLIAIISLVYLFLVLYRHKPSAKTLFGLGCLFGAIICPIQFYWLAFFQDFSFWALLGISLYGIICFGSFFPLLRIALSLPPLFRCYGVAIFWSIMESFRGTGYLAFPWGIAGNIGGRHLIFAQIADFTGMVGLSFLVVLVAAVLADFLFMILYSPSSIKPASVRRFLSCPLSALCIVALCALYGFLRLSESPSITRKIDVLAVQPNTNSWEPSNFENALSSIQNQSLEALKDERADVIVWPETFLRIPYREDYRFWYEENPKDLPFSNFLSSVEVPLISGASDRRENSVYNSAILIDTEGDLRAHYAKRHLVLFGEMLPGRNIPFIRHFYVNIVGIPTGVWDEGTTADFISLPHEQGSINFAPLICFEDSMAYLVRNYFNQDKPVHALLNITNNSWAQSHSALAHHLSAARFRSIETRLPFLRVGNNGMTHIIDPYGRILDSLPTLVQAQGIMTLPIYETQKTPYLVWGESFSLLLWGLGLLLGLRYRLNQNYESL